MKIKYSDLINQTFAFPQEEFELKDNNLEFHGIPLYEMVQKYGSPLKFTYLPKISENIQLALAWFKEAMMRNHYRSEEHTSELQSRPDLVCRRLVEKKKRRWGVG